MRTLLGSSVKLKPGMKTEMDIIKSIGPNIQDVYHNGKNEMINWSKKIKRVIKMLNKEII